MAAQGAVEAVAERGQARVRMALPPPRQAGLRVPRPVVSGDTLWAISARLCVRAAAQHALHGARSTLVMRRDLSDRLSSAGYNVFWTVLLNKLRHDHTHRRPGPEYRWLTASASYLQTSQTVELRFCRRMEMSHVPRRRPSTGRVDGPSD